MKQPVKIWLDIVTKSIYWANDDIASESDSKVLVKCHNRLMHNKKFACECVYARVCSHNSGAINTVSHDTI